MHFDVTAVISGAMPTFFLPRQDTCHPIEPHSVFCVCSLQDPADNTCGDSACSHRFQSTPWHSRICHGETCKRCCGATIACHSVARLASSILQVSFIFMPQITCKYFYFNSLDSEKHFLQSVIKHGNFTKKLCVTFRSFLDGQTHNWLVLVSFRSFLTWFKLFGAEWALQSVCVKIQPIGFLICWFRGFLQTRTVALLRFLCQDTSQTSPKKNVLSHITKIKNQVL